MPTAIIADDERLMRDQLRMRLQEAWPELQIVGEAKNGEEAVQLVGELQPDLTFLDIRMPGKTGMEAAREIGDGSQIVFVTAYDQYALDAFDRGAVDYLLKPVSRERLSATVTRVRERLARGGGDSAQLAELLARLQVVSPPAPRAQPLVWLTASRGHETRLILVDDVAYFQADSKYTVVMTLDGESLLRKPIRDLLEVLDPTMFKQVHRSTIVNLRAVAGVARDESGRGTIRLKSRPETLTVSQSFMGLFRNM